MAASYEKIIADKQVPMFSDYAEVKAEVMAAKRQIDAACNIAPVPCHNDVLCENWVVSDAGQDVPHRLGIRWHERRYLGCC